MTESEVSGSEVLVVTVSLEPDSGVRAAVSGELDVSTVAVFRAELRGVLESRPDQVEIDCAGVPMIDSVGMAALLAVQREGERIGCRVVIGPDGCRVTKLFQVLRLPVENEVVPAVAVAGGAGDDRAPVDPMRAGAVLGHAERDIEECFRSITQGFGDGLDMAVARLLAVVGAASLSDAELADPRWAEALELAAELAGAYLVVGTGQGYDVRLGFLPEYLGTGVAVEGDGSLRLGVDEWRRAVELATLTRSIDPQPLTALLQEAGRLPAPDYSAGRRSPRANLYTRMLASWDSWVVAEGERREQLIGQLKLFSLVGGADDDGEFVAELEMMAALVAADPAAFDDALRRALAWHRTHVPDGDIEAMGHLVAYRPAVLVALARKVLGWPVAVDSGYLPAGLFR